MKVLLTTPARHAMKVIRKVKKGKSACLHLHSEIIVAKEVKTRMQLLAYTNNQKCERKNVIAEFIINRGPLLRRKM